MKNKRDWVLCIITLVFLSSIVVGSQYLFFRYIKEPEIGPYFIFLVFSGFFGALFVFWCEWVFRKIYGHGEKSRRRCEGEEAPPGAQKEAAK